MSDVGLGRFGFVWGPMQVERLAHIEGRGRVLEVRTDHARIQVHVTEKGRRIHVHELEPYESREAEERVDA